MHVLSVTVCLCMYWHAACVPGPRSTLEYANCCSSQTGNVGAPSRFSLTDFLRVFDRVLPSHTRPFECVFLKGPNCLSTYKIKNIPLKVILIFFFSFTLRTVSDASRRRQFSRSVLWWGNVESCAMQNWWKWSAAKFTHNVMLYLQCLSLWVDFPMIVPFEAR